MKYPPLAVVTLVAAFVSLPAANGATSGPSAASGPGATSVPTVTSGLGAAQRVAPGDLWFGTISPTHTGRIHSGCKQFADPEEVVGKGPITRVAVYGTEFIHGIRLRYGSDGIGLSHGFTEPVSGLSWAEWDVPDGERITRVEGAIARDYIVWLRFVTDRGTEREFGKKRGRTFVVSDPGGGALRTISGWANHKRHPSLYRAVTSLTFQFGAPYFIKKIDFDEKALDLARLKAAPEQCASQDFTNETSVEQAASYTNTLTLAKETRVTFESAFGLRFTTEAWIEAGGKLVKGGGSMSFESSAEVRSGRSFSSSREEQVSWSVPVRVPPHSRVVASSTWRKYPVSIPFTYTVAWYVGSKDNIKKEVKLPGLYEDVRVDDLKHDFKEVKLTGEPGRRGQAGSGVIRTPAGFPASRGHPRDRLCYHAESDDPRRHPGLRPTRLGRGDRRQGALLGRTKGDHDRQRGPGLRRHAPPARSRPEAWLAGCPGTRGGPGSSFATLGGAACRPRTLGPLNSSPRWRAPSRPSRCPGTSSARRRPSSGGGRG